MDIRVKSVPMILSSVLQSEITFHTDYHRVCHGWICYELFYVRKKRNPWLIRGHLCEELSPWPAVVCFKLRLCFTRIITEWVTDDFVTSFFMSEKRNPWLIRGHPCEALSPWFSVVCFKLRLSFTRIITDCVTDGFVTSFFVWKEKSVAHPWISVWRVVSMASSSVLQSEITFHTDYHGVGHGWFCYELFCLKEKSVAHPWTSVWRVVSMILSSVLQPEITFHTDYHGLGHGWICYELFLSEKRNPWLIRGHPCEELSPWFSA